MSTRSIETRFAVTVVSNVLRGGISFLTGIVVARGLGPNGYGNLTFLLGSFAALRVLLDMGTSTAFYTFLSRRSRTWQFIAWYAAWQLVQFVLPFIAIGTLIPQSWIEHIWIGQNRGLVLLAFAAVFLQQQAWQTITQIGDSHRRTVQVQLLNLGVSVFHLILIWILWETRLISVRFVLGVILFEYLVAMTLAISLLGSAVPGQAERYDFQAMVREYAKFCKPLVFYSWVSFIYVFADSWMLQRFGGSTEQAYFAIGNQFATIGLLATTAMSQIFWKEVAEAHELSNLSRVAHLYRRVSRSLFIFTAGASAFFVPWSSEIIRFSLGSQYIDGNVVLAIMFLYPVYQSLGQIVGTMFYAVGKTTPQVVIGMVFMIVSIPVTYFVLAPLNAPIPGLNLGAVGIAAKMVVLQIISVNILAWWIARSHNWRFDWGYQVFGAGGALLISWIAFTTASAAAAGLGLAVTYAFVFAALIYLACLSGFLWCFPELAGWTRTELRTRLRMLYVFDK